MVVCLVVVGSESSCPCLWPGVILFHYEGELKASDLSHWSLPLKQEHSGLFEPGCKDTYWAVVWNLDVSFLWPSLSGLKRYYLVQVWKHLPKPSAILISYLNLFFELQILPLYCITDTRLCFVDTALGKN